jgi:hypothetical protein
VDDLAGVALRSQAHQWSLQIIVATLQVTISAVSIGEHMLGWSASSCVSSKPKKT